MARRHKLDIFADILRLAINGAKMTRLVYQANTNFSKIKSYLDLLSEKGLIESHNDSLYTTDKGIEYIEKYEELIQVINSLENKKSDEKKNESEDIVVVK